MKYIILIMMSLFIVACTSAPVILNESDDDSVRSSFSEGQRAFSQEDYTRAFTLWLPLAEGGYVDAQDTVAFLYLTGRGVDKNLEKAFFWYQKSAQQGQLEAMYHLGNFYKRGKVVEKNTSSAESYYRNSYCGGYEVAIVGLLDLVVNHDVVDVSDKEIAYLDSESKRINELGFDKFSKIAGDNYINKTADFKSTPLCEGRE